MGEGRGGKKKGEERGWMVVRRMENEYVVEREDQGRERREVRRNAETEKLKEETRKEERKKGVSRREPTGKGEQEMEKWEEAERREWKEPGKEMKITREEKDQEDWWRGIGTNLRGVEGGNPVPERILQSSDNIGKLGGRLLDFVTRWEQTCGGGWLLRGGFRIFWGSRRWKTIIDTLGPKRGECWQQGAKREAMRKSVEEGLQLGIIQEVDPQEVRLASPSYVVPKANGGFRQVLDLRRLNRGTKDIPFKMEDTTTLMELAREGDYATSLDIKSAFNHVPTNPSALFYLSFFFNKKAYVWKGMPFGAKHAPLIFTKVMKIVLKYIRMKWQLRCVGYMDDLLFLHQNQALLRKYTKEVAQYMQWIGWVLSTEKCEMEPKQQIVFLGWKWDFVNMELSMKVERRKEMRKLMKVWLERCRGLVIVKVRDLAALLGKVNFLRAQFPRIALYTVALNRAKVRGVKREGWNGKVRMTFAERSELCVMARWIDRNQPRKFQRETPQATLVTDASMKGWGAILRVKEQQWFYHGDFRNYQNRLTSSNQRETMAVRMALEECMEVLEEEEIKRLCIESDNTTTVSNIVKVRAARSMVETVRVIFLMAAKWGLELSAKHLPGVHNEGADALSRLEGAGDYELKAEIFRWGLSQLLREGEKVEDLVEIDLFASAKNTKLPAFITPNSPEEGEESDAFSIRWEGKRVYAHPPILMIAKALRKIEIEKVEAVVVTPSWPSQPWWPQLVRMEKKHIVLGRSEEVLIPGPAMRRRETKLPPGTMTMWRIY
jgi:hypothetical protein